MALNRALRLRKNSDFQRVRQQGGSIASRLLILAWKPNDQATLRVGFVVSKRISKRAVQRNYIKRLLAEAVRSLLVDIPPGWDIVFSARNQIVGVRLPVLMQDVSTLLRRARLLANSPHVESAELNTRKGS
ncbi:ribonuclease P protein component [Dictyobacter kobayashii]|uniref:Ribonuclease P protein component n=1 Tax=Dictyobacter kobayashii TaxID=2014872 RepID=A0A402AJ11_9CHLR|nr:ribonuclease P protein component [Dictyobacter kobayashii]GCE19148.1 ribonuclease P protein component [Dictyobacter kobayashii]